MSAQDVRSRDYYYDVLLLNGRVLPAKKSSFCTLEYLYLVVKNEVWTNPSRSATACTSHTSRRFSPRCSAQRGLNNATWVTSAVTCPKSSTCWTAWPRSSPRTPFSTKTSSASGFETDRIGPPHGLQTTTNCSAGCPIQIWSAGANAFP